MKKKIAKTDDVEKKSPSVPELLVISNKSLDPKLLSTIVPELTKPLPETAPVKAVVVVNSVIDNGKKETLVDVKQVQKVTDVILSTNGPLDATRLPDLTLTAKIFDTDEFRQKVALIVQERHPNGTLIAPATLSALIQATCLEVDSVSAMFFGPLLVSILKQVFSVKVLKSNRTAKVLLTMELFKAFIGTAFGIANLPVPDALVYLCGAHLDSFLALIIKQDASLVDKEKLSSLVKHQAEKLSRRAIYLQNLTKSRDEKLKKESK